MGTLLAVLAIILAVIGVVGAVAPGLPGPPLSWAGLLLVYLRHGTNGAGDEMSLKFLLFWLAVTVLVTVVDYLVPAWFTKLTGGSKYAGRGAIIGLFAGLLYPPVGMIFGALIGAFVAELFFARKDGVESVKSSVGAFLGFLFGTGIKLVASGLMFYYIIVYL
ncbi:MAG: DUF456 domain-containing protein [Bacteroidales bacterium]|nr:DUF456 domain-containing protein [Bacteroidales bacterium]MBQ5943886.1 DUF456 domain-containing protein [Bacteroidales bacterium]